MKVEANFIDYGIYIDRKHAFIVSLNHVIHEQLMDAETEENTSGTESAAGSDDVNQQTHIQNSRNENLKKYCKSIIAKLVNAHSILIFGPSVSKFELQKEIREHKQLKHVNEALLVSDVMDKNAAIRFVADHYTRVTSGAQVFTSLKTE